jgi:hypothetical protein
VTPERIAELVARWVRLYTRNLPPATAQRRIDEIDADLHDHVGHERAHGTSEWRIALGIATRMIRGLPADAAWRGQRIPRTASRSAVRVALVTASILLLPLVAMQITDGVDWGAGDFALAAALLGGTGLLFELSARKPGAIAYRAAAIAIGVAAILFGEADDAPGLVLFGGLLILATVALAFRTAQGSSEKGR